MKRLKDSVKQWLIDFKENSVKPSTYDRLMVSYEMMCKYDISGIYLEDLTSSDVQRYMNELVRDGYALSTIKKQYHLLSEFIDFAILNDEINKPIHKGVKIPSESAVRKHKKEVIAYTRDEQKKLRRILERGDSPMYYLALMMMETGMRIGEALALRWEDVDFRRRALRIRRTIVRLGDSKRSYVQNSAKSHTSNRIIPLSNYAYTILENMRDEDNFDGFVFHKKDGSYMSYEASRWWMKKACDEAGVEYYGQHVFRHTFATNCYERGCDVKMLSKLLGHSDVTITYNVYIHLFGDALEEMRSVIG